MMLFVQRGQARCARKDSTELFVGCRNQNSRQTHLLNETGFAQPRGTLGNGRQAGASGSWNNTTEPSLDVWQTIRGTV